LTFDMVWLMGGAVKLLIVWGVTAPWEISYVVQLDVLICRTTAPWWTWRSSIVIVKFHIPWFQALVWLHVDSIQEHIIRVYKSIFQSWNNQCIKYKVEHCDSIQKHILRVYIMKYTNLGTMNASSIRWSMAASS
jgi:hypothetical protein